MKNKLYTTFIVSIILVTNVFAQNNNYNRWAIGGQLGTAFGQVDGDGGTPGIHIGASAKYSFNNRFAARLTAGGSNINTVLRIAAAGSKVSTGIYESNFQFIFNAVNFRSEKADNTGVKPITGNVYFGLGYGYHYDNISFEKTVTDSKNSNFGGYFALSFGYKKMLSNKIDGFAEFALRVTDNDYLEGFNPPNNTNRSNDYFSVLQLGLCYNLGVGSKNIEWTDNYDDLYQKQTTDKPKENKSNIDKNFVAKMDSVNSRLELLDLLLTDTDNDGVSDYVDQEAESKTSVVDVHGITLDTDKDGVPDYLDKCHLVAAKTNDGCPEEKIVISEQTKMAIKQIVKGILFEPSKAIIKTESYDDLNKLADILIANAAARLTIEGHTDNLGDSEKNLILSQHRADAVLKYLVDKGINKSKVFAVGYGDAKPIANNKTPQGRAKNRRVELKLY